MTLPALADLKTKIEGAVAGAKIAVEGPALVVDRASLLAVARYLRDDAELKLDYLANLCALDWTAASMLPGSTATTCLEVAYHLYSVPLRHGPVPLKCRTANRGDDAHVPSVTPIWRGAEYQEREAFDLYGVIFDGHPDMRRILMWDEFTDHPMRKDYKPPDDYEWEPTPHDSVVDRVREHQGIPAPAAAEKKA